MKKLTFIAGLLAISSAATLAHAQTPPVANPTKSSMAAGKADAKAMKVRADADYKTA